MRSPPRPRRIGRDAVGPKLVAVTPGCRASVSPMLGRSSRQDPRRRAPIRRPARRPAFRRTPVTTMSSPRLRHDPRHAWSRLLGSRPSRRRFGVEPARRRRSCRRRPAVGSSATARASSETMADHRSCGKASDVESRGLLDRMIQHRKRPSGPSSPPGRRSSKRVSHRASGCARQRGHVHDPSRMLADRRALRSRPAAEPVEGGQAAAGALRSRRGRGPLDPRGAGVATGRHVEMARAAAAARRRRTGQPGRAGDAADPARPASGGGTGFARRSSRTRAGFRPARSRRAEWPPRSAWPSISGSSGSRFRPTAMPARRSPPMPRGRACESLVICPAETPDINIRETAAYGAEVIVADGQIDECGRIVGEGAAAGPLVRLLDPEGALSPRRQEGDGAGAGRAVRLGAARTSSSTRPAAGPA